MPLKIYGKYIMSFTVVCNSANGTGADASALQYSFDWSMFAEGSYKLTSQFTSLASTLNNVYFLSIPDFGANLNSHSAGVTTSAGFNNYLGCISNWNATAAAGYLTNLQSLPRFLENKPRSNTFTVRIVDVNGAAIATPVAYILVLNFEKS